MQKIILASGSPRRKELLNKIGLDFYVMPDDTPENVDKSLPPQEIVTYLARFKGENVRRKLNPAYDALIIAADTVVSADGETLGKPKDRDDAFRMLSMLGGRSHHVYTGVYICNIKSGKSESFFEKTEVLFKELEDEEIKAYIDTGEPMDKAGAYGIQEYGAALVKAVHGDYFNVVGLPLCRLCDVLRKHFDTDIF